MEIERKFLLPSLPDLEPEKVAIVCQGYISTEPEVRIRSQEIIQGQDNEGHGPGYRDYLLTVKGDGNLSRKEIETHIDEDLFQQLAAFIQHPLIRKEFYLYYYRGHHLEISIIEDLGGKTIFGEVEFENERDAEDYEWPFRGAFDITEEKKYKMKNIWKDTRLKINPAAIKSFSIPSFEEWDRNERNYKETLGDYTIQIEPFSWSEGKVTYASAIAKYDVPNNIWVEKIFHDRMDCDPRDTEFVKMWYNNTTKKAQDRWIDYISKKYLG